MEFFINKEGLTRAEALELLAQPREFLAIDIETVSLKNHLCLGIGVSLDGVTGAYFFKPKSYLLKRMIEEAPYIVIHNAAHDIPILDNLKLRYRGFEDTMLLAYSAGFYPLNLEYLSKSFLHAPYTSVTAQWRKKEQGNVAIDHQKMGMWCMQHALNTHNLWVKIPRVPLYDHIDRPSIDLVLEMEGWGVLVDQENLTEVEQESMIKAIRLERQVREGIGLENLNLYSNPQMAAALRLRGIIGTRKTKSDKDSVSDESLRPLNHPITNALLEWRSTMKTLSTYVPAFRNIDNVGRMHPTFGYTGTGRWSNSNPNLQNITRDDKFKWEEE